MAQADIAVRHRPQDGVVPAQSERPPDRRPPLDAADRRRREAGDARHRQPQSAAPRSTSLGYDAGHADAARAGAGAARRPGARDRTDRLGQDHRALRRARPPAHRPHQHRQRRGSGRAQHSRGHADSRERARRQHLPDRPAIAAAPGSERDHGRRDPRRRSGADRRAGRLHRPPGAVLDAHRRHRDRDHPADQPRARAVQGRREPVGGPRAAAVANALPALPSDAHRVRTAAAGGRAPDGLDSRVGRPRLRTLQVHRLLGPAAGDRAADALRRPARRDRPRRHRPRDPRRDAGRRRAHDARAGAAPGGRRDHLDRRSQPRALRHAPSPAANTAASACWSPTTSRSPGCW